MSRSVTARLPVSALLLAALVAMMLVPFAARDARGETAPDHLVISEVCYPTVVQTSDQEAGAPKRAFAIVRVSDRPADQVVYSPEMQRNEIETMAAEENLDIVEWGEDIRISGRKAVNRATKVKAIELAEAGLIDVIAVADWSRWSREEAGDVVELVNKLRRLGVHVYPARQKQLRPGVPFYWSQVSMYAEMVHMEAKTSADKASVGIGIARKKHGVHWGKTPLGWRREGKLLKEGGQRGEVRLVPDWEERDPDERGAWPKNAHTLKWLYEKRAEGWGWRRLAAATGLSEWGIQYALTGQPKGAVRKARAARGTSVEPASLRNRGTIVSETLYDQVQAMGAGASSHEERQNRQYLFTGLVRCPVDNFRMVGRRSRTGSRERTLIPYMVCKNPHAWDKHEWRSVQEAQLLAALRELFPAGVRLPKAVRDRIARQITQNSRRPSANRDLERREARLKQLRRERDQVLKQHRLGVISDREMIKQVREIDQSLAALPEPIERVQAAEAMAAVEHFAELIPHDMEDPGEVVACRLVLRRMVDRIELSPKNKRPRFVLKEPFRTALAEARAASPKLAVLAGGQAG